MNPSMEKRQLMSEAQWLLTERCKDCGVWASDRTCDCDVEEE